MTHLVLSMGSNLGDRLSRLQFAFDHLLANVVVRTAKSSAVFETRPVGGPDQPSYLNVIVVGDTTHAPTRVLELVQEIENAADRQRLERWGPRTLDIDIVDYSGVVTSTPQLTLPHRHAHERAFVLVPWAQLEPDALFPGSVDSVGVLAARVSHDRSQEVREFAPPLSAGNPE